MICWWEGGGVVRGLEDRVSSNIHFTKRNSPRRSLG